MRITADDVGRRVSVRSRLAAADGGPTTTDTLGRLLSWSDGQLRIERRDGTITPVLEADLLAGKVISDRPPQRRSG